MNKLESLKKLLETIENAEKLANGAYCKGSSNCVIGHLLKIGGVTDEQLKQIDTGYYGNNYTIVSLINNRTDVDKDFVGDALVELGFNLDEDVRLFNQLQSKNDYCGRETVIEKLKEAIAELEEK